MAEELQGLFESSWTHLIWKRDCHCTSTKLEGWRSCHYYIIPTTMTTVTTSLCITSTLPPVHKLCKQLLYMHSYVQCDLHLHSFFVKWMMMMMIMDFNNISGISNKGW